MTMITPSYLGETIEYSSLHACRSTLEDPTARGGHAPGHLRDWFVLFVETGNRDAEMVEQNRSTAWLFGQLWNCTDIMPSDLCTEVDLPVGSTYACGAREMKRQH